MPGMHTIYPLRVVLRFVRSREWCSDSSIEIGKPPMAVYRLFRNRAFEPEALTVMSGACADVCRTLGLHDADRSETDAVAKKIIEFAQRGVNDQVGLCEQVLQSLQG